MSLPDCKDIGGEEPNSNGFCPVDFYVPTLHYIQSIHIHDCPRKYKDYYKSCICDTTIKHLEECDHHPNNKGKKSISGPCICEDAKKKFYEKHHVWRFPERVHGFVAGCVWSDDFGGWKIEYLDLSRADEGILKREQRFGYIEMPEKLHLKDAIIFDIDGDDSDNGEEHITIRIATENHYDFETGKILT